MMAKISKHNHGAEINFVTGANGRLGKEIIKELVRNGETVRALVKKRERIIDLPKGTIPFVGSLSDRKVLKEACDGADNIFHFAAIVGEYKISTNEILAANVEGTANLLNACDGAGISHFIFSSSVDVYGAKRKEILAEDAKPKPTDKYGFSKMLAEEEIILHRPAVPYTILRLATMYGKGFERSFFKVFRALSEGRMYIIGKGSNKLSLVNSRDAIRAALISKGSERSIGRIYNISDGVEYTQEYLLDTAADLLGVPRPKSHLNEMVVKILAKSRGLDTDELRFLTSNRTLNISRAKNELGFAGQTRIEEGGKEIVAKFLEEQRSR
jgi:nucleoside-diphosphate-sugar epimerase